MSRPGPGDHPGSKHGITMSWKNLFFLFPRLPSHFSCCSLGADASVANCVSGVWPRARERPGLPLDQPCEPLPVVWMKTHASDIHGRLYLLSWLGSCACGGEPRHPERNAEREPAAWVETAALQTWLSWRAGRIICVTDSGCSRQTRMPGTGRI